MSGAWSALRFRPAQALVIGGLSMLVAACAAFAPLYDRAMEQAAVDQQLRQAPVLQRTIVVTSSESDGGGCRICLPDGGADPLPPTSLTDELPASVRRLLQPPVLGQQAHVTSPATGDGPLIWRGGGCGHVRLVRGSCPARAGEIAVSAADVSTFGLTIGSRLPVKLEDNSSTTLSVVGVYAPVDTEWWQDTELVGMSFGGSTQHGEDGLPLHDTWLTSEQTFTAPHTALFPGQISRVGYLVDQRRIGVDELLDAADRLRATGLALRRATTPTHLATDLPALAAVVRTQDAQGHRTVPLLMVQLGLLFVVVLWLVLTAATDQRRQEVALARLRGSGTAGGRRLLLGELLPAMLAGVPPGVVVAVAGCALVRHRLPGEAPLELTRLFWASVGIAVVMLVLLAVAAAYRVAREPLDTLLRRQSSRPTRWALGALDAVVVTAAGCGAVAFLTGSLTGPLALVGPALLALTVGLLLAHLAGAGALVVGRRLLRRGRLLGGTGVLDAARSPATRRTVTVVTVACALVVFAIAALAIGNRNWQALSEQQAGAAEVLELKSTHLAAVEDAVRAADPSGHRATPVVISGSTLAVEPDGFSRIALFPAGAPTAAQWKRLGPPDVEPVRLTGERVEATVTASPGWTASDLTGHPTDVFLGLLVADRAGMRNVSLGVLPTAGRRATLSTQVLGCPDGCTLAGLSLIAVPGSRVDGTFSLTGVIDEGRPVALASTAADWPASRAGGNEVAAAPTTTSGRLDLQAHGDGPYPIEIRHAWVPSRVPALVAGGAANGGVTLHGLDGADRAGTVVATLPTIPTMRPGSQLVDLEAIDRGSNLTPPTRLEVWLAGDDPGLAAGVSRALHEHGIEVSSTRSLHELRTSNHGTVTAWSLELAAGVGVAGVLVALLVLLVLTVTGWRQRSRDLAALRMAGVRRRTVSALATWPQLGAVVLAAVAGIACGLVGVHLAMPKVPLFVEKPAVDVLDLGTPWRLALATAAVCLVVLAAAAILAGRAVARRARLERVRETV
jgi:hypothetical protein